MPSRLTMLAVEVVSKMFSQLDSVTDTLHRYAGRTILSIVARPSDAGNTHA